MKSKLLVRPNLKLFLVGALLLAALQDLMTNGQSEASILVWSGHKSTGSVEDELQKLLARAEKEPSPDLYAKISGCYERVGDAKNARLFWRRAETLADLDE